MSKIAIAWLNKPRLPVPGTSPEYSRTILGVVQYEPVQSNSKQAEEEIWHNPVHSSTNTVYAMTV